MPLTDLALASERYRASGGFAGEGVRRLMGAPNLSMLQTLVRESLQNSCDAGTGNGPVRALIRLRRLKLDEVATLRTLLSPLPDGPSQRELAAILDQPAPVVMEICDWGTWGLGGPTRADAAPPPGTRMDFVNFIRNVGAARDTDQGGGTYGYGKTALFVASRCGTIVVDTRTTTRGGETRRLIAAHLGETYDHDGLRFTGRHWWGERTELEDLVEPLTGEAATEVAAGLGLPYRGDGETGTSILILDPDLGHDRLDLALVDPDLDLALGEIEENLLWFFWPKMVDLGRGPAMEFRLAGEAAERRVGPPDRHAPLDLFVDAYRKIHERRDVQEIRSQRPGKLLGRLAIRKGPRTPRQHVAPPDARLLPHTARHIAVMRPVELIVKYIEGMPLPDDVQEWAGVFICDEDHEVERAFADAEPPAHDDWIPDKLPSGRAKTFVRVALRELTGIAAAGGAAVRLAGAGSGAQGSMARAAERLARLLPATARPRSGSGGGGSGGGSASRPRVEPAVFEGLRATDRGIEASFLVRGRNATGRPALLTAAPCLVIDGALTEEREAPGGQVSVLGWRSADGAPLGDSPTLELGADGDFDVRLAVHVPPGAVVGVALTVEASA